MNKNKYRKLFLETVIKGNASKEETREKMSPIWEATESMLPKKVYRFRTCSSKEFDALLESKIYFGRPENFNDPYDCMTYIDALAIEKIHIDSLNIEDVIKYFHNIRNSTHQIEKSSPNILPAMKIGYEKIKSLDDNAFTLFIEQVQNASQQLDNIKARLKEELMDVKNSIIKYAQIKPSVACFSESIKSIPMWGHYAQNHRGFAIEYNSADLYKFISNCTYCKGPCEYWHATNFLPILYGVKRFDATKYAEEFFQWQITYLLTGNENDFVIPDKLFYEKLYTQKHIDWKYEKEWRLIYRCKKEQPNGNSVTIEPTAIYLGSKISKADENIIQKLIESKPAIRLYKMRVDENDKKYRLKSERIK